MTIAQQKKEENIIEYVLYLWQMQDLVRAANFDLTGIRAFLTTGDHSHIDLEAELTWFGGLIKAMQLAKAEKKGHIPETDELLVELNYLHHTLIDLDKDKEYTEAFNSAKESIDDFLKRSGNEHMNPIEAAMTGMYGWLVLRLQKKEVSPETLGAMKHFQGFLALLAVNYKKMRSGNLNYSLN